MFWVIKVSKQLPDPNHNEQMFESMFTDSSIFTSCKRSGKVINICHNFVNEDDALACHNASHWAQIERTLAFRTNIMKNLPVPSTSCKHSGKVIYVCDGLVSGRELSQRVGELLRRGKVPKACPRSIPGSFLRGAKSHFATFHSSQSLELLRLSGNDPLSGAYE